MQNGSRSGKRNSGPLFTVPEVAEILRMHSVTVYRFVKRGVIPGFKVGNTWRISRASLDHWLSESIRSGKPADLRGTKSDWYALRLLA